jgi:hypothetical protein
MPTDQKTGLRNPYKLKKSANPNISIEAIVLQSPHLMGLTSPAKSYIIIIRKDFMNKILDKKQSEYHEQLTEMLEMLGEIDTETVDSRISKILEQNPSAKNLISEWEHYKGCLTLRQFVENKQKQTNSTKKSIIGYCRKSADGEDKSIEQQKEELTEYAKKNNLEISEDERKEFEEKIDMLNEWIEDYENAKGSQ